MLLDYMNSNNLNRLALVGTNSQGKSYLIATTFKKELLKKSILIGNEVKADENLKNSADNSTLITWLNTLMDNSKIKDEIDNEINKIDLSEINKDSFLNISLQNNLTFYKGIISAEIKTSSNKWENPGSGEKFLGQLILISKILEDNKDETYEYLVIDEPEQHLHPSLYIKIASILNKLSKQGIKVIIATHSPVITQYFVEDTNEIVKVTNGNCKYLPKKDDLIINSLKFDCYKKDELTMSDYTKIKDKYTDYFNNFVYPIVIKSLFCRYMLVGEGVAERKIFELYLLKYGEKLNKNDIDYCVVDGKIFFPCILQTLKDIGIKTITLHDLDAENQAIHKYLNEQIKLLSNEVISLKPDLENYLGITQEIKKQENYDKYRVATIMMNQYYLDDNLRLNELFDKISQMLEKLNSEEKQGK